MKLKTSFARSNDVKAKVECICGADISTASSGFALVSLEGKLLKSFYIETPTKKYPIIYHKVRDILIELRKLKSKYEIKHVYIEEPLLGFHMGKSSVKTLALLQQFNGMVSFACYEMFSMVPIHINASSARKLANIKKTAIKSNHTKNIKPIKIKIFEHIAATEPGYKFLTTGQGNVRSGEYDRADAIIIAKAGAVECRKQKNSES